MNISWWLTNIQCLMKCIYTDGYIDNSNHFCIYYFNACCVKKMNYIRRNSFSQKTVLVNKIKIFHQHTCYLTWNVHHSDHPWIIRTRCLWDAEVPGAIIRNTVCWRLLGKKGGSILSYLVEVSTTIASDWDCILRHFI